MKTWQASWTKVVLVVCLLTVAAGVAYAAVSGGFVARNVGGTVPLPNVASDYYGQFHLRFPAGTDVWARHFGFRNVIRTGTSPLGGISETFDSTLELQVRGNGVSRNIPVAADSEVFTGPINLGAKVQTFSTEMNRLEATLTGDPDFDYFRIVAGGANGYPSPGTTTITDQGDGTSFVQSSFEIGYRIDYRGSRAGFLRGQEGSFEGRVTMSAYPAGTATPTTGP
jgi:hypothetical protein